jgi:polysaccharide biosynthesis transport protein
VNPRLFLIILRQRWKLALLVFVAAVSVGTGAAYYLPKRYIAEAAVMVDIRSPDPISALLAPGGGHLGSMGTQVDIIKSDRVARKVTRMLKLNENPGVRQMWIESAQGKGRLDDWIADLMQRGLKVTPSRDSSILTISYQGRDPVFVAAVANAYADAYIEASVELKVEPARQYAEWFGGQAKVLRESLESAQSRLSEFQQKKGIVVTDEHLDFELTRLNELSARLMGVQQETRDAQSKRRSGDADTLPEVMNNPVILGLRSSIAQLEGKITEAAPNLGAKHPAYIRMQTELAELKKRLVSETTHLASSYGTTTTVGKNREGELRSAIEAQRKKVLDMKQERDQIAVLLRDVETAKRAYEAVTNRYNQVSLESQATRTNVSILTPAIQPLDAAFPKPLSQMLLLAAALGAVLACAAAMGMEMLDRRIRSAEDLGEMLQLPVLAVIERRRWPRRLARWRAVPALPLK